MKVKEAERKAAADKAAAARGKKGEEKNGKNGPLQKLVKKG